MKKEIAILLDIILVAMASNYKQAFNSKMLSPLVGDALTDYQINEHLHTLLADGYVDAYKHPNAPDSNFGFYFVTPKGIRYIRHEGGYTRRIKTEMYKSDNLKFDWFRHWAWFIAFIISMIGNLYLLLVPK